MASNFDNNEAQLRRKETAQFLLRHVPGKIQIEGRTDGRTQSKRERGQGDTKGTAAQMRILLFVVSSSNPTTATIDIVHWAIK